MTKLMRLLPVRPARLTMCWHLVVGGGATLCGEGGVFKKIQHQACISLQASPCGALPVAPCDTHRVVLPDPAMYSSTLRSTKRNSATLLLTSVP
jgi:hypothetical protein